MITYCDCVRIRLPLTAVCSVIVSAGLMALVDNTIRERFHAKQEKSSVLPKVEYVGPKRLINEMFRPNRSQSYNSRPSTSHGYPTGSRVSSSGS
jgi:hypothetical protein